MHGSSCRRAGESGRTRRECAESKSRQGKRPAVAAWGAASWAFGFAAVSFYWAAGGRIGVETIARQIERVPLANDPRIVAATGLAKVAAGGLPLALGWARPGSMGWRLLRVAAAIVGGGFALYGSANFVDHGLMVSGLRQTPDVLGATAARWHLLFWDPFWMLGGALSLAAARWDGR
ncbi:MAG TPA: DUF3995 domain-containing protein [Thermomicrobiales bacterium]|nr:DUF3995 domain-containing protein [Thermomicrobiales bacterium]